MVVEQPKLINFLLPHELALVQSTWDRYTGERNSAVNDAKEGLQASGDWTENGPVEAAREEANRLVQIAAPYGEALRESTRVDYPEPDDEHVRPGSYVVIDFMGERLGCMVVGFSSLYERKHLPADPDVDEVMTTPNTLANALLGKRVGEDFSYTTNNRTFSGRVALINQVLIAEKYATDVNTQDDAKAAEPTDPVEVEAALSES